VDVGEIVARLWPGRAARVERLGGGITNHNFKVVVGSEAFVLRIGGNDTDLLGIERSAEHRATLAAAAAGVGPEVVNFVQPEGYLVTRFVPGRPIPPDEMRAPARIAQVARTLRRYHEGPPIPARFDSFRIVDVYRRTAEERGVRIPDAYEWAHEQAVAIERARGSRDERPCHNDLLNANFLDEDGELRIVDWEYAGMGDVFFDLANLSINHEFGDLEDRALLEAYFDELRPADAHALRLMRFMSDFREAMWGVVQQGISELDFDFVGYADEHFARLRRTAADPAFRAALDTGGGPDP
jgi:thiamine kinase-like enzyme